MNLQKMSWIFFGTCGKNVKNAQGNTARYLFSFFLWPNFATNEMWLWGEQCLGLRGRKRTEIFHSVSIYLKGCGFAECAHEMPNDASVNCSSIIYELHQSPEITSVVNSPDLETRLEIQDPPLSPSNSSTPLLPLMLMYAGRTHHEGDGEVVQSGGWVIMVQVRVQVPWRRVGGHGLNSQLPVDERRKQKKKRWVTIMQDSHTDTRAVCAEQETAEWDTDHAVLCSGCRGWEDMVCGTWMWCPWP